MRDGLNGHDDPDFAGRLNPHRLPDIEPDPRTGKLLASPPVGWRFVLGLIVFVVLAVLVTYAAFVFVDGGS